MIEELKSEIEKNNSLQETENGAIGFSTTGNELVDLNFRVPSFRDGIDKNSLEKFRIAMQKDLHYAVKWLFFVRDIRGGLGEKRAFVELFVEFYKFSKNDSIKVLSLISEYGRWKDIFDIIEYSHDSELNNICFCLVENQLKKDIDNYTNGKGISLLAKWIPSINASDKIRPLALMLKRHLGLSNKEYRQMLSKLRSHLDVLERKTCSGDWGGIDYGKVPSKANLLYKDAFLKHDYARRNEFLKSVLSGGEKINASVLYPYEIWAKYCKDFGNTDWWYDRNNLKINKDLSLEALWENLKDVGDCGNTMVVCDGSGSMETGINGSRNVLAIDVSRSLSVYFAERCNGEFKNRFIEFSREPKFIDISGCRSLAEKIELLSRYDDCTNTDIEKVFLLILKAAVDSGMKQSDLPDRILIISDMEFDGATTLSRYDGSFQSEMKTLFENIGEQYKRVGYKMPKLVFWNVCSRTNTIPVVENECGVILVSGFSVNIVKLVMSGDTDPWKILKGVLDSERYSPIDNALGK